MAVLLCYPIILLKDTLAYGEAEAPTANPELS